MSKKGRKQTGNYLIEGFHLLTEALKFGQSVLTIFVSADKVEKFLSALTEFETSAEIIEVTPEVLKTLADSETPQGVVAVVKKTEAFDFDMKKVLVLENVQDPGNVGTMVRTADAAGFDAIFTTTGTADIYSAKVMRSMQGSNFHLPIIDGVDIENLFSQFHQADLPIFVTTLADKSVSHKQVQAENFALVMGNEGNGVSDFASQNADKLIHIDMPGQAESLNVAVAAGILMFSL